ncbi:oxidoreductase [Dorea sp. OM07-5]|uniref:oxidoreductase n=1 Tax=Dorea sp. OM07-5 TaxID=2293100 RepID=UPI001A9B3BC3|nr:MULTISPECIES: hypothetical protein [Dorea]
MDPTDLTKEQLKEIIEDFANAAERAKRCGFDSLVVHRAHGQLPGCFLSKVINRRTDEYSADTIENASRFTKELLAAIRKKIGNTMAIEYRINASDMVEGSPSLDDEIAFAREIEDKIDLLHVSRGLHAMQNLAPYMNQPLHYPHGINLEDAAKMKEKLQIRIPVIPLFNHDEENIRKTAEFCKELGDAVTMIQLLPYHNLGVMKYLRISDKPVAEATPPSEEYMQKLKGIMEEYGLNVSIH